MGNILGIKISKIKYALIVLLFFSLVSNSVNAATFSFNVLYKGTGTAYGLNTQSITGITTVTGTNFQFYQAGDQFTGNDVNGMLTYYDNFNNLQTIYGIISRQDKTSSTSLSFYFLVSNTNHTTLTGEAYLFVIPGKESNYTAGASVTTSSDPFTTDLNNTVASLNSINLSSASGTDGQTVCKSNAITNITYSTTGATGASFTGLPSGVTGSWASNTVTISGTPTVAGTYNYKVTLTGGSASGFATGTIIVNPSNTITLSSAAGSDAQTPVINAAITNITYTTTGATGATFSGLPAGVTGSWASNLVTISGTATVTGTYNYTITLTGGCSVVTKTGSIEVNPEGSNTIVLNSAVGTNAQTICINTAITNITYATTNATGATFTGLPSGVTGSWASNAVTISGTATVAGTFNYKVQLTGGIGTIETNGTITVNPLPNIGISGTTTNPELVSLTATASEGSTYAWSDGSSTSSSTNTFDASGLYSLSVTDANGCISSTQLNITVQQYGLSRTGEKTLDSTRQISSSGQIGSLNPISQDGKKKDYKRKVKVGDSYRGGIVAYIFQSVDAGYIDDGQQHGLIAAPLDEVSLLSWSNAITACDNKVIDVYNDWYLPSLNEIEKLYNNRVAIGGFADNVYWSSTQYDSNNAYSQYFNSGNKPYLSKNNPLFVRAIRAF